MRARSATLGLILCPIFGLIGSLPAAAQATARIGLSAPLTGPDAAFGQGLRLGAEQAVADLNRAGPQRFALTVADDGGDPRQAGAIAARFATDGISMVVGPFESAAVAAAAAAGERAGTVVIAPGATYGPLTGRGLWNLFRLGTGDPQQGRAAADYLAKAFAGRPVAIVSDQTTFGRSLADAVAGRLHELDRREAVFEGIDRGTRDFGPLVARLSAAKVAAVYFGGLGPDAAGLVRAMREARLGATLVASDGILGAAFAALGPAGEGTVMTMPPDPPRLPEGRAPRPPRSPEADAVATGAYAAVQLFAQALDRGRALDGRTGRVDGRKLAQALHDGGFKTVLGPVAFDGRGDLSGGAVVLRVWRRMPDGRLDYAGQEPPS
ncbi:branched-chain amino acid ABC transporter substrate-binding protein [Methylobacterium sp. J-076]|uniref:branched-chain amino acid ABC transporter substrate-binding protein n=1 Tax=Methylobacterium sp. J-076 TaxID=2836655 RepID=UPI001FB93988|nr:branched-chain amino acid ABC transporter substrate-binding protein [Methylobacterium sp. J-076]MCJ2015330.1 branched-chain amino acid ABC transporter substrate-binding protein [Methylobacterium sp. J-076]